MSLSDVDMSASINMAWKFGNLTSVPVNPSTWYVLTIEKEDIGSGNANYIFWVNGQFVGIESGTNGTISNVSLGGSTAADAFKGAHTEIIFSKGMDQTPPSEIYKYFKAKYPTAGLP